MIYTNKNYKYIILVVIAFFASLYWVTKESTSTFHYDYSESEESEKKPSDSEPNKIVISNNQILLTDDFSTKNLKFNQCFKAAAINNFHDTDKFFLDLSACLRRHFKIPESQMDYFKNYVGSERKVFLSMAEEYRETECRWLTIGIGGSTAAEEALQKKYPNCVIYGVEPTNYGNFSKIGKLYTNGVGIEDDEIVLSVDVERNGKHVYEKKVLSVVALTKMLDEFVHSRFLHYLAIDIEGLEMLILAELIGNGKFANENITFCQIDVELHNPKQGTINPLASKINRVQWMLDFLADSSPYIPIFTKPYQPAHKVTFVNFVHPECERAFKIKNRLGGTN